MTPPPEPAPEADDVSSSLLEIVEEAHRRLQAGEPVDLDALLRQHPARAEVLTCLLPAMEQLASLGRPSGPPPDAAADWFGDYRLLRRIGQGGMGVVYEAAHAALGRTVALKVLSPDLAGSPRHLERFKREALAAGRLHHTNIVPIFTVGEQAGVPFYVMQLIPGLSLDVVLHQLRALGQSPGVEGAEAHEAVRWLVGVHAVQQVPAPGSSGSATVEAHNASRPAVSDPGRSVYFRNVARLGIQAAEALAHAHDQGILHRDVKPSNLILAAGGAVWMTDFGVARVEGLEEMTHTGEVVGTLRYLAPERLQGRTDRRSDLYSLGLTLYELLTLRPAFPGTDRLHLLEQLAHAQPPAPRTLGRRIPRDLETIVLKSIEKDPARRYQTAAELADDLRRFLEDRPIRARPLGVPGLLLRWCRRHPAVAGLSAALLLAVAALVLVLCWSLVEVHTALGEARHQRGRAEQARDEEQAAREKAARERDEARDQTYRALLGETHALRLARPEGWRAETLASLHQLARMDTPKRSPDELRTLALSCLALGDVRELPRFRQSGLIHALDLSDGGLLALATATGVTLWDGPGGHKKQEILIDQGALQPAKRTLTYVRFSPDGRYLVHSAPEGLRFHPLRPDVPPRPPLRLSHPVSGLSFDQLGQVLAVGGGTHVTVHNLATGAVAHQATVPAGWYNVFALSPDGQLLATGAGRGRVSLYRVGEAQPSSIVLTALPRVSALAFSPDSRLLAVGTDTGRIDLRDVTGTVPAASPRSTALEGHTSHISSLAFSADGQLLASTGWDRTVRLWDVGSGQAAQVIHPPLTSAAGLRIRGDRLAVHGGGVRVYDLVGYRERWRLSAPPTRVLAVAFHPRQPVAVLAEYGLLLTRWDFAAGRRLRSWRSKVSVAPNALAISPDGRLLAAGFVHPGAGAVGLWNAATGERVALPDLPVPSAGALAFDGAGRRLAVASGQTLVLWDLLSGKPLWSHALSPQPITGVCFAGQDDRLVSAGSSSFSVWDPATGRLLHAVSHDRILRDGLHAANGRRVVIGGQDGRLRCWGLGRLPAGPLLADHGSPISAVAVDRQDRWIASAGQDRSLTLWDARTLRVVLRLPPENEAAVHLLFSPDGRYLASSGNRRDLHFYDLARCRAHLAEIQLDWTE